MSKQTSTAKTKFNFDFGLFLLFTGGLSNVTLWVGAFTSTSHGLVADWLRDAFLPFLDNIAGLAMAVTVAAGLIYVIARLNQLKPTIDRKVRGKKKINSKPNIRFYSASVALVVLFLVSLALLAPFEYMRLSGQESLFETLGPGMTMAWSIGRVLAADLALGAIALVSGVHVDPTGSAKATSNTATSATESGAHPKVSAKGAKKSLAETASTATVQAEGPVSAPEMRLCDVPGCGIEYRWPNGKGAHFKKHHPDLVIGKAIPVAAVAMQQKLEK